VRCFVTLWQVLKEPFAVPPRRDGIPAAEHHQSSRNDKGEKPRSNPVVAYARIDLKSAHQHQDSERDYPCGER
jgi:hypothetical protein